MRKLPYRANNDITQNYNSGVVKIYAIQNVADVGLLPVESLSEIFSLPYEEQRLGLNRLYLSRQFQVEISRVIRIPRQSITTKDIAITEDGEKYSIDTIQSVDGVFPPSLDISLVKYSQKGRSFNG